jgi:hypothetical protein
MPYYGLEVIAFDNCPAGDFTGSNRRMIAVQADFADDPGGKQVGTFTRVNDIKLAAGSEFGVIDGNACDGDAKVTFETVPGICSSGTCQSGSDLGRLCTINEDCGMVGKPGGKIDVKTCTTDPASGVCDDSTNTCTAGAAGEFCSTNEECDIVVCSYTNELLTLCLDEDGDGDCDTRVPLFSTQYEDYFWNWNTQGRPHAQLRFYPL